MNDSLSNDVKKEVNKIKIPEDQLNHAIDNAIKRGKRKKHSLGKKIGYLCGAAILLFGLFIGSAFVSPAMAKVASKIPFLSSIFESEPAEQVILKKLEGQGFKIQEVGLRVKNKTMTISIGGSEKYYKDVKDEVKSIAKDVLQSKQYDAYKLKVTRYAPIPMEKKSEKEKLAEKAMKISEKIIKKLKQKNFNILQSGVGYSSPKSKEIQFSVNIPKPEKRIDLLKKIYHDTLQTKDIGPYSIKIHHVDVKRKAQEERWSPVIDTIFEGLLAKKEYKVTGEGYSFYPLPLRIEIRTSIQSSDPHARELGKKIENTIRDFIESKKIQDIVKKDPYRIVVLSKDKKKIN